MAILGNLQAAAVLLDGAPATVATNATASVSFDTVSSGVKFNSVQIISSLPIASASNVSAQWQVYRVEHSNDGTTWTTCPGLQGTSGTPAETQFQINVHNSTTARQNTILNVDCRGIGNRLRVVYQPPASTNNHNVQHQAFGYRADVHPDTTTEMGVGNFGTSKPG